MKENFIHVCFVIDSSGSMCGSEADVIGGFKRVIEEQKTNKNGSCAVTVIDFNSYPEIVCVGKDVHDVDSELDYTVGGGTALFDAITLGINKTHEYNMNLDNAERPEKTMVVIMTDGGENCSRHSIGADVKARIKEASEYVPLEHLCLSTQCGFSSTEEGNVLSHEQQWAKIRLVVEIAKEVWADA